MQSKYWEGIGVLAIIVAGNGIAGAADMSVRTPAYKAAPPVILSEWAGFYLGVHGGYGWGDMSFDTPFANFSAKPKGGVFGGQAGYNWQFGRYVIGVEADYSAADLDDSGVVATSNNRGVSVSYAREAKVDELASARARLGYAFLPGLLVYGTGGLGWGHTAVTETVTNPAQSVSATSDVGSFGWAAGAGLEYKFWGNFIARAEYLHYDLGTSTYSFPTFPSKDASTSVDVARAGVSYKF